MDDRQLAVAQLSVAEQQKIAVDKIKDAVILSLNDTERAKFYKNIEETNATLNATGTDIATKVGPTTAEGVFKTSKNVKTGADNFDPSLDPIQIDKLKEIYTGVKVQDMFMPAGDAPTLLNEGTLYKGIVGDEVAIGTNLTEAFNKSGKLNEIMSSIASTNNSGGGNASVDGKIDININLTGAISGDRSGDIEKMFSDPRIQKQIMDTVLYKLDSYKNQQGVLSK